MRPCRVCQRKHPIRSSTTATGTLCTSPPALCDHVGHLLDLGLGAAEGTEPLLRELARALVFAVAEEFDYAALVWGEAV